MKIWLFSDIHLEYADLRLPFVIPDADVCIAAGDLCRTAANGVYWLAENIAHAMPCVYVAGNHESYKGSIREGLEDGHAAAAQFPNMHFLENESVVIDSVRFLGATLWTDYRIEGHPKLAMFNARERMNDHKQIALRRNPWQRFVPEMAYRMHQDSRHFIDTALKADPIKTVVVTHHLPYAKSIPLRFKGDLLNAAYASDLFAVIEGGRPALWAHGHTHDSCDYQIGATRIVCNPRGYDDENEGFDRGFLVTV
jgi:Icc-related predicted phosphoesterase